MNEFERVNKASNDIIKVLNESGLTGMTMFYLLGDIQDMIKQQIMSQSSIHEDTPTDECVE